MKWKNRIEKWKTQNGKIDKSIEIWNGYEKWKWQR